MTKLLVSLCHETRRNKRVFCAFYSTRGSPDFFFFFFLLTAFHPLHWALTKSNKPNIYLQYKLSTMSMHCCKTENNSLILHGLKAPWIFLWSVRADVHWCKYVLIPRCQSASFPLCLQNATFTCLLLFVCFCFNFFLFYFPTWLLAETEFSVPWQIPGKVLTRSL